MDLLRQLGELFLAAVPTAIVVFLFYLVLRWSFFAPMERIFAERKARISGAQADAATLKAAAIEKQRNYRETLRKARSEILAEQDAARRVALEERGKLIQQARRQGADEVQTAKARLAEQTAVAKAAIESSASQLAEEVAQTILEPAGGAR
jgi:F-type H+-transporting ATPase subunit b